MPVLRGHKARQAQKGIQGQLGRPGLPESRVHKALRETPALKDRKGFKDRRENEEIEGLKGQLEELPNTPSFPLSPVNRSAKEQWSGSTGKPFSHRAFPSKAGKPQSKSAKTASMK